MSRLETACLFQQKDVGAAFLLGFGYGKFFVFTMEESLKSVFSGFPRYQDCTGSVFGVS